MEYFVTWVMLIFSLGFFIFTIRIVTRDHRESWERRIMEAREFGFGNKNQHNAKTLHEK